MSVRRIGLTSRTILVHGNNPTEAFNHLRKLMRNTGLESQVRSKEYYEKPTWKRVRKNYEKCVRIYNREMGRKIAFVFGQNDPLPSAAVQAYMAKLKTNDNK